MKAKHLIPVCLVSCVLSAAFNACSNQPVSSTGYTITGTADGTVDGDTVYLCEMQGFFGMNPLDSAYIKDGKFEFKGETEGCDMRFLIAMHGGKPASMAMFILENANIKATVKPEGEKSIIEGGPNQKLYEEYEEGSDKINTLMEKPWQIANDSTASEATRQLAQQLIDSLQEVSKEYNIVKLFDPQTGNDADVFTIEAFAEAWADSQNFMVVANEQDRFVYDPQPIDVNDTDLSPELLELGEAIAENAHEIWAMKRKSEGWDWGPERNDSLLQTPDMTPYSNLSEEEKDYDRQMAMQTLKLVQKLGYRIVKDF